MTARFFSLIAALLLFTGAGVAQENVSDYKLVWSDEFNSNGLPDTTKWSYDAGGSGWGNNEKQYYTYANLENAKVNNGLLYISAIRQKKDGSDYTSARITTKNKGDWKYGRVEVRAQLPKGRGAWPAIWMLPTDWKYGGWPASGEIDIMEHVGFNKDSIFGSLHSKAYNHIIGTQKTKGVFIDNPYDQFHVFAIEWLPGEIRFLLDDTVFYKVTNEYKTFAEWPFDQKFHLILNIAVGGNWGGMKGIDESAFPAIMKVDYVRVYQK